LSIKTGIMRSVALATMLSVPAIGCAGSPDTNGEPGGAEGSAMKQPEVKGPRVLLETSMGNILIGFYPDQAPITVENFLAYVESGHYDGLVFHRVIPDFMIQVGGFEADLTMREGSREPIRNESDNGLHNVRGTIVMARTNAPHSASAQFFIGAEPVGIRRLRNGPRGDGRGGRDRRRRDGHRGGHAGRARGDGHGRLGESRSAVTGFFTNPVS